jgi:hypothetical protein
LPEFQGLNNLKYSGLADPNLVMFFILNACPELVSLIIQVLIQFPDVIANKLLQSKKYSKMTRLTSFEFNIDSLTAPYMKYIISHVPAQLEHFRVAIQKDMNFDEWI